MMRFFIVSLLTFIAVNQLSDADLALAQSRLQTSIKEKETPSFLNGTVIGNAKFVEYSNAIYGLELMYPEQWNLVDSGQSVNIVAYQPEGMKRDQMVGFELPQSIDLYFEDRFHFDNFISFERYVKSQEPQRAWKVINFKGMYGFRYDTEKESGMALLRPDKTALKLSFPLEGGLVPLLVEKTIESIVFH
jgi:hypothetical protein